MNGDRNYPVVTRRDFKYIIRLPLLFALSLVLPERTWKWVTYSAGWIASKLKPKTYRGRVEQFARAFGISATAPCAMQAVLRASHVANEAIMQCFREYRWGGWHPELHVTGREHLEAALRQGNGAIVWVQSMPFSKLVAKKALAGIGFPPHHLTRPVHGFSASRFGIRFLNPIWTRIEDRYLSERITIRGDSAVAAMRTLLSRLKENRVVSITVDSDAVKTVVSPFFNAKIKLATGPISLSLRHGAPLIPVFAIRSGDGGFEVIIDPPLSTGSSAAAVDGISVVAGEYAARLECLYREHADQRIMLDCVVAS